MIMMYRSALTASLTFSKHLTFTIRSRAPRTPLYARTMSNNQQILSTFEHLRSTSVDKNILLLDGGTGEELFRRGVPDDRKIWSATALVHTQYHDTLEQVHRSFLQAGAQCITTNSYGVIPGVGFTTAEMTKLATTAGKIARQAVEKKQSERSAKSSLGGVLPLFVVGSLGPLVESYRADLIKPHDEGVALYKILCRALSPSVDAFLAETMSCVEESMQVIQALSDLAKAKDDLSFQPRPLLVSYTLDSNGNLRDGESPVEAIGRLLAYIRERKETITLLGIMFNCAEPEAISTAIGNIRGDENLQDQLKTQGVVLGAYANRLTAVQPSWTMADSEAPQPFRKDLDEFRYWNDYVQPWITSSELKMVGGCCGITPEHIAVIAKNTRATNNP